MSRLNDTMAGAPARPRPGPGAARRGRPGGSLAPGILCDHGAAGYLNARKRDSDSALRTRPRRNTSGPPPERGPRCRTAASKSLLAAAAVLHELHGAVDAARHPVRLAA